MASNHAARLSGSSLLAAAVEGETDQHLLERFARRNDQVAFEALLSRHGPMVLGLCRRVLDHEHDAEDAFQATFLVLAQKARTIANPELLGSWLYGVAYRIARKARAQASRHRQKELHRETPAMPPPDPLLEAAWKELRSLLDEELRRLPHKYQAPLVLCYLEGLTNEEAAARLDWPAGSISYRLARGREMLRTRLAGRHRAVSPVIFASLLASSSDTELLPATLSQRTLQAVLVLSPAAAKAAGLISPAVEKLVRGAMVPFKRRALRFLLIAVAVVALAAGSVAYAALGSGYLGGASSIPSLPPSTTGSEDNPKPSCH